jgi:GNAT superfamily N-acetyltransferase
MTSRAIYPVTTRRAAPADAALLTSLGVTTFVDTYAADNTPGNMAMHLAASFSEALQRDELSNPCNTVFFAEIAGETVGYAMLREGPAPDVISGFDAVEILRFYAARQFIGAGVGAALMRRCLDEAAALGKRTIWLGVWEHNTRALVFYRRWGFINVGTQTFTVGHDVQTDYVLTRRITAEE